MTYTDGIWARWIRQLLRSRVRGSVAWKEMSLNKISHYWRFTVSKENTIASKRDGCLCIFLTFFYQLHTNRRWSLKTIRGHKWPSPALYVRIRWTERDLGVPFATDARGCSTPNLTVIFHELSADIRVLMQSVVGEGGRWRRQHPKQ
jgi:hypothetical protein